MPLPLKKPLLLISVIALIFIIVLIIYAAHMPNTSKEKGEPEQHKSLYQQQADKICLMLNQAVQYYKSRDLKKAYTVSENAYWNVYDNILEIKYRPYATPATIFSVEGEFHATSDLMKKPVTSQNLDAVNKKVKALCAEVNKQAHELEHYH